MFRGSTAALTLLVFGTGLGIGFSWSRGLIPLTLAPTKTGSLSVEVAQRERLPPPNLSDSVAARRSRTPDDATPPDDPVVFEQQKEPDEDRPLSMASRSTDDSANDIVTPALLVKEAPDSRASDADRHNEPENDPGEPPVRVRLRERSVPKTDLVASEGTPRAGRSVTVVAHQDPTETPHDVREGDILSPESQLAAAEEKLEAGEILAAHRLLSKLYWNHKEFRPQIQDKIAGTAKSIFFQSQPHFVEPYVIQSGDRLEVIARKYQLSWEYLAKLNRTEPKRIQSGQKLKVVKGPFAAVVDLREFALTIHLQGYYVKRYPVCIGKDGSSPVGKFAVLNKVENPPYTGPDGKVIAADDPSNPLGERWIDLGDSYGIHGTIDPESIGKAESRGCIRMGDREVIEVYNFLVKGSEVVIRK